LGNDQFFKSNSYSKEINNQGPKIYQRSICYFIIINSVSTYVCLSTHVFAAILLSS